MNINLKKEKLIMRSSVLLALLFIVSFISFGQKQLDIEGSATSADTVAKIKANYSGTVDVLGLHVYSEPATDLGIGGYFHGGTIGLTGHSPAGDGLYGSSNNGTGTSGTTRSSFGVGVFGYNSSLTGDAKAIYGKSISPDGIGVYGENSAVSGATKGVYGSVVSPEGSGVYGEALSTSGYNSGVYGTNASTLGVGVFGQATASVGAAVGVQGRSTSLNGIGVMGVASHTTGGNYGVYGSSLSSAGYAGFFSGRGYFSKQTGIGSAPLAESQLFVHNDGLRDRGIRIQMNPSSANISEGLYVNMGGSSSENYGVNISISGSEGMMHGLKAIANKYAGIGASYGSFIENISTAGSTRYGSYNEVSGTSGSAIFGVSSIVSGNSGFFPSYGLYARVDAGTTTGGSYGLYVVNNNGGHSAFLDGKAQIVSGSDASYTSNGFLQLGNSNSTNVVFDNNEIMARDNGAGSVLHLQANGGDLLLCDYEQGGVGIGILNASSIPAGYLLAVDGKAIFEEVRVELSSAWPDYVFSDQHKRLNLDELHEFIKLNGHLPNIPAANTIESEGLDVGDMQRRMMEKIEELTLYVIEQNERILKLETKLLAID
jgi:hypothetical protein